MVKYSARQAKSWAQDAVRVSVHSEIEPCSLVSGLLVQPIRSARFALETTTSLIQKQSSRAIRRLSLCCSLLVTAFQSAAHPTLLVQPDYLIHSMRILGRFVILFVPRIPRSSSGWARSNAHTVATYASRCTAGPSDDTNMKQYIAPAGFAEDRLLELCIAIVCRFQRSGSPLDLAM